MRIVSFSLCILSVLSASYGMASEQVENQQSEKKQSSFPLGGDVSLSLDAFRSLPDGSWGGNMGAFSSLNLAYAIPRQEQGIGIQLGGSYGIYDWDGNGSTESKALQQQTFLSLGLFRMTPHASGINAGAVYDWNINSKLGIFGLNPTVSQVRGQLGWLFKGGNEFGFLGSYATEKAHKNFDALPVTFKAINQVNAFWRHVFKNKGETMVWAGTPYGKGLMYSSGRAGTYIVGASFKAPLTRSLSVDGHGVYMGARGNNAYIESRNYAANVCFGITYSFGGRKMGSRPYLALANNSNFLMDTNTNY